MSLDVRALAEAAKWFGRTGIPLIVGVLLLLGIVWFFFVL